MYVQSILLTCSGPGTYCAALVQYFFFLIIRQGASGLNHSINHQAA